MFLCLLKLCFIDNFVILQFVSGLYKETDDENWGFCDEKKALMVKVAKSCHQITWTKKCFKKEKTGVNFYI